MNHFCDDQWPKRCDVLRRHSNQDDTKTKKNSRLHCWRCRDCPQTFGQTFYFIEQRRKFFEKRIYRKCQVLKNLPWISGICFWYWSISEQNITNANLFSNNALCSNSKSLLEKRLKDPDWDMDATLAEKKNVDSINYTMIVKNK